MDYQVKYLKYKKKYLDLKQLAGAMGAPPPPPGPPGSPPRRQPSGTNVAPGAPKATKEQRKAQSEYIAANPEFGISLLASFDSAVGIGVSNTQIDVPSRRMQHNGTDITNEMYQWVNENVDIPENLTDPISFHILEEPIIPFGTTSPEIFSTATIALIYNYNQQHPLTRDPLIIQNNQLGDLQTSLLEEINKWWTVAIQSYQDENP